MQELLPHMSATLILTDDRERSERLARRTQVFGRWVLHDLYGDAPLPKTPPGSIVSDLLKPTSDTIARLQRVLAVLRGPRTALIWLLHDNSPRAQMQAKALKANRLVAVGALLSEGKPQGPAPEKAESPVHSVQDVAKRTGELLAGMLYRGQAPTPPELAAGATLVLDAVRAEGVHEWLDLVGRFDDATLEHCLMVAGFAAAFGLSLALNRTDAARLTEAALLHDVGKSRIPRDVLNKPGPLDADERQLMREHAAHGYAMLQGKGFDPAILAVVRSHHEMLDGSGYPDRLEGNAITDLIRLVTICDVFAALVERRPYRAPLTSTDAYATLLGMNGRLDADLVRAFQPVAGAC